MWLGVVNASSNGTAYEVHHMQHSQSGTSTATATTAAAATSAGGETPAPNSEEAVEDKEAAAAAGEGGTAADTGATAVDIAYSADASMVAIATEGKHVRVWRTGVSAGITMDKQEALKAVGDDGSTSKTATMTEATAAAVAAGDMLGEQEIPKKPTSILFAPVPAAGADGGGGGGGGDENGAAAGSREQQEVLVIADKCGDAYAAPLPDPSSALKHLLGHTAMTITAMAPLQGGALLATADRAEHIRVSQVRTYCMKECFFRLRVMPLFSWHNFSPRPRALLTALENPMDVLYCAEGISCTCCKPHFSGTCPFLHTHTPCTANRSR